MALIRKGLEIYGMKKDGSTIFVSKNVPLQEYELVQDLLSEGYDRLWQDALNKLKQKYGRTKNTNKK